MNEIKSYCVPASPCPNCGVVLDAVKGPETSDGRGPHPGAWSLCVECLVINRFDEEMGLRRATIQELEELRATQRQTFDVLLAAKTVLIKNKFR